MLVSSAFKWTVAVLATVALAAFVVERVGWLGKLVDSYARPALVETGTPASEADSLLEKMTARIESVLPRFFPGTTDINQALKDYASATNLARRTELAYDLVALKFRNDLRSQGTLSPQQEKIYENALAHLGWTQELYLYYLNKLPVDKTSTITLSLGEYRQSVPAEHAKRMLAAGSGTKKVECSDEDFSNLREIFSDEQIAMNGINLIRIFLLLNSQIHTQLAGVFEQRLVDSAQNDQHREVLQSLIKIREISEPARKENSERDKKQLQEFFENKNRDNAFSAYAAAPNCFKGAAAMQFTKKVRRLQSELRGRFYVEVIRANYKKTHRVPEDLNGLGNEAPLNDKEEFYRQPRDGWNATFQLKVQNNHVQLISSGPDYKFGTEDDFVAAEGDLDQTL